MNKFALFSYNTSAYRLFEGDFSFVYRLAEQRKACGFFLSILFCKPEVTPQPEGCLVKTEANYKVGA